MHLGRQLVLALFASLLMSGGTLGQGLEHDVSERLVEIRPTFHGTDLLFFGSLSPSSAEGLVDPDQPLDVIVVVRGPPRTYSVRRKERVFGLWLNRDGKMFAEVPGYYFLASTRPISEIASPSVLFRYGIGSRHWDLVDPSAADEELPQPIGAAAPLAADGLEVDDPTQLDFSDGSSTPDADEPEAEDPYRFALREALGEDEILLEREGGIEFIGRHLFRAEINMPANVPQGHYGAEVYLIQDDSVIDAQYSVITVDKKGLERSISELAQEHSFFYGLLGVFLAVVAGWLSAFVMRKV